MKLRLFALAALAAGQVYAQELSLPPQLVGKAQVLNPGDADYAQAVVDKALQPPGMGGIYAALVVRVTEDIPVYRMWNGPGKTDARGNTNRLGAWWSYDAPGGAVSTYRSEYEICRSWNDLTWVATCTLKKNTVVAIGPGQSVTAETCGDPTGQENYPMDPLHWQLYVNSPWNRTAQLVCPPDSADYAADPADIARKAR